MTAHFELADQIHVYQERLQRLLESIRQSFETCPVDLSGSSISLQEKETLEKWIAELNLWYYKRFHQTFFPFYKTQIAEEISAQFDLSQDQETLEQNILFVYKYNAQLYNQLIQILSQITQFERRLQTYQLVLQQTTLKQGLKFYNQMQELEEALQRLLQDFIRLSNWSQKIDVRLAFKQFPGHFSILPAIHSYSPSDRKSARFLNTIQLHIQLQLDSLQKMKGADNETSALLLAFQNTKKALENEPLDKKIPAEIRHWYKQYFCLHQQLYVQNIEKELSAKNFSSKDTTSIEQYESWLTSLLIILQQLWLHPASGNDSALQETIHYAMAVYHSEQDQKTVKTFVESIQTFLQSIQPDRQFDTAVLLESARPILQPIHAFLQKIFRHVSSGNALSLLRSLQEVDYTLSMVEFTFDEITENIAEHQSLLNRLNDFVLNLRQYQQGFDALREILNRQLQNRQAERCLKSVSLKIDRWTLTGQANLPQECVKRMTEQHLQHFFPQLPLQTEGDLFILQIGALCECVVPYIVQEATAL